MTVLSDLSAITAVAASDGVEVRVNVEGQLVGLSLTPQALLAGPVRLAATISRLADAAAATALNEGIEILTPYVEPDVTAELRSLTIPPQKSEEDYSSVESWAVPH